MSDKLKIGLIDDRRHVRQTFEAGLKATGKVDVVITAENGFDFFEKMDLLAPENHPRAVFVDIEMPELNGIETIRIAVPKFPNIDFVILTVFDDEDKIFEALKAGAKGYLLKEGNFAEIHHALEEIVIHNGAPMSPRVARKTLEWMTKLSREIAMEKEFSPLTKKEMEVLKLLVEGKNNKLIAEKLAVSAHTVRNQIASIYEKLRVNTRVQAVRIAMDKKWV